jgi:hypothetical protein
MSSSIHGALPPAHRLVEVCFPTHSPGAHTAGHPRRTSRTTDPAQPQDSRTDSDPLL